MTTFFSKKTTLSTSLSANEQLAVQRLIQEYKADKDSRLKEIQGAYALLNKICKNLVSLENKRDKKGHLKGLDIITEKKTRSLHAQTVAIIQKFGVPIMKNVALIEAEIARLEEQLVAKTAAEISAQQCVPGSGC